MGKGMTMLILTMLFFFTWAFWVSSNTSVRRAHKLIGKNGRLFNLEESSDSKHFDVEGFTFYNKSPMRGIKLKAKKVWFIANKQTNNNRMNQKNTPSISESEGKGMTGTISIRDLQVPTPPIPFKRRAKVRPKMDVTVLVKYHVDWDGAAFLSVTGTDTDLKEEVSEDLPQQGESYCTRIVFLGPVNDVKLEAVARDKKSFVIIDEFQVSVGTSLFDDKEEVVCV